MLGQQGKLTELRSIVTGQIRLKEGDPAIINSVRCAIIGQNLRILGPKTSDFSPCDPAAIAESDHISRAEPEFGFTDHVKNPQPASLLVQTEAKPWGPKLSAILSDNNGVLARLPRYVPRYTAMFATLNDDRVTDSKISDIRHVLCVRVPH